MGRSSEAIRLASRPPNPYKPGHSAREVGFVRCVASPPSGAPGSVGV